MILRPETDGGVTGDVTTSGQLRLVAAATPEQLVLRVDDEEMTYGQLDRAADALAARIVKELGPGQHRVGLQCAGTKAMFVGAVGIMRAGKVSVPIDPTAPEARVQVIINDVAAPLLLSDVLAGSDDLGIPVADPLQFAAAPPPGGINEPLGELASVIFTSGSTGVPKGIMVPISHRVNLRRVTAGFGDIATGTRIGMIAAGTVGFSETMVHVVIQIGSMVDAYEIRRLGLNSIGSWLLHSRAEGFATVPTILRFMLPTLPPDLVFPDLRIVVLSGETATWEDIAAFRPHLAPEAKVFNSFGLTETSGISTYVIDGSTPIGSGPLPAGLPRADGTVTIVGEDGQPVADGAVGEIVVESPGCALGYWARPDLTASVFTVLPDGTRRVRTGDAGRWGRDGMLEHLGRLDHVVKISGNRVELGEVEVTLRALPAVVAAAAATVLDAAGNNRLVAFAVVGGTDASTEADGWALRRALARRLPGPMVPDRVHVVDELPSLPNGKVDRRQLPDLDHERQSRPADHRPMDPTEAKLAAMWAEILDVSSVGHDDDFFELGGDSLRASRLFVELQRRLGVVRPVSLLVEASTVRRLAAAIATGPKSSDVLLPIQVGGSKVPLFAVHDGIGDVFYATRLAGHLGDDQPVYAVQPSLLLGDPILDGSFEDLAARYLNSVRAVRPHGPYLLYGASLGGLIAFEMGRQLQGSGEDVALLAVGDSVAPGMAAHKRAAARGAQLRQLPRPEAARQATQLALNYLRHLAGLVGGARSRVRLRQAVQHIADGAPLPLDPGELADHIMYTYGLLAHRYRPATPFDGSLLLIRAGGPGDRPDRGWKNAVTGEVRIVDVPGAHNQMGLEPYVAAVSEALGDAVDLAAAMP